MVVIIQQNGHGNNLISQKNMKERKNFNEIFWHDAIIKNIQVDRNKPGIKDTIDFEITWMNNQTSRVVFEDVYWAKMLMGFGVVADECIYEAFIAPKEDIDLICFKEKWKELISENLFCYIIRTASTGSEFKIIAKSFKIL